MALTKEDLQAIEQLLDRKLDEKLDEKLDSKLDEKLAPIVAQLETHTEILEAHTKKLDAHTELLETHTEMLESHNQSITVLERRVTHELRLLNESLPDAIARRAAFEEMEARVDDHGHRIYALEQAVNK